MCAAGSSTRRRWDTAAIAEVIRRLKRYKDDTSPAELVGATYARSPYHLLVSCIISLRTKEDVTKVASERLLQLAPRPADLAAMHADEIAAAIYPAGFYNTKAKQLKNIAQMLCARHQAAVPSTLEELLGLPGVGRKTANLVLGVGFGLPAICVDTHVHRISNRLGWVETKNPSETEKALQTLLDREHWIAINDLLVTFGQHHCVPVSPHCSSCCLATLCPRVGVNKSR